LRLVDQTLFGDKNGNCFPACVATVLGIPLDEIPNWCVEVPGDDGAWYRAFAKWLNARGLAPVSFNFKSEADATNHLSWAWEIAPLAPWIAGGPTSRGQHSVVYVGRDFVHDPNPRYGRAGLDSITDATFIVAMLRADWRGA
jgi:hypothetical protein